MHRAVLEGSRMGQQELDAVQREQVCTLERELAAEREVCAHVRAALRESEVSRQEMAEVFEVVGFTAKHGKTQAQELLAERHVRARPAHPPFTSSVYPVHQCNCPVPT